MVLLAVRMVADVTETHNSLKLVLLYIINWIIA